jgi:hypothetical protein
MVEKGKGKTTRRFEAGDKATGSTKVGLHCIGEICFTDAGFVIKLPEDADPKCAKKTAELILGGRSNVVFEVPGKGIISKEDLEDELSTDD